MNEGKKQVCQTFSFLIENTHTTQFVAVVVPLLFVVLPLFVVLLLIVIVVVVSGQLVLCVA